MSSQRIVGIVLLAAGIVLLFFGLNASSSVVDQVSESFTGRFTETTTWYILGGITASVLGLLLIAFGGHRTTRTVR